MKKNKNKKKKLEFSKGLLAQESLLIWVSTLALIVLAYICITKDYCGELPWIAAMASCPWGAYAVSQMYYYKKASNENTAGGIKYESVMAEINKVKNRDEICNSEDCCCEDENENCD